MDGNNNRPQSGQPNAWQQQAVSSPSQPATPVRQQPVMVEAIQPPTRAQQQPPTYVNYQTGQPASSSPPVAALASSDDPQLEATRRQYLHDEMMRKVLGYFNNSIENAIQALQDSFDHFRSIPRRIIDGPVLVRLENVSKQYKLGSQTVKALNNVSLEIKAGEFVALTGTSGSGKSTLLQLIGALDKPSTGRITVGDRDISQMNDSQLSVFRNQTIGFVFQFFFLQPFLDVKTNIEVPAMFGQKNSKIGLSERSTELASAVGLSARLKHLPKELSGGQMQRVAIARALLNQPKILLADEPTGNLDSANTSAIIDLFEQVRERFGTTIIIITHDQKVANRADREIVMHDGAIK